MNRQKIIIPCCTYHLIWIMTLLEALTVPLLVIFTQHHLGEASAKSPWQGFIIGAIGAYITFSVINFFLRRLNLLYVNQRIISAIKPVWCIAIWSGCILMFLFLFQKIILHLFNTHWIFISLALAGFVATALSILLTYFLYRIVAKYTSILVIFLVTPHLKYQLYSFSIIWLALLAGIYEAIALPIINTWTVMSHYQVIYGFIFGALGGLIGSSLIVLLYNNLMRKTRMWMSLQTVT